MGKLVEWKSKPGRKPLILNGARQVGKTWLLCEFGKRHFDNVAYVSLDNNTAARSLFEGDFNVSRIISGLSVLTDETIVPEKTLIILDEVQAAPSAITSLKYFCEQAPEYAVATAGSLLGLSAHEGSGYSVGKVDSLDLYPLTFTEFLDATGTQRLADLLRQGDEVLLGSFGQMLSEQLKRYYLVGGMPAAVVDYLKTDSLARVRETQTQILNDYARDFAKLIPVRLLQKTIDAWESIPAHLAQENKKFVFGHIREGARAKDYEESLMWLDQAGLIHRVERVSKPGVPLNAYSDRKAFKVFMLDVGLLCAACDLDVASVLEGNLVFTEFKGALTEQYVCQQLIAECAVKPYYWSAENSRGEIDFIVQRAGKTYPIEVKAEENLRSRSLRVFSEKYKGLHPLRFSLSGFRDEGWMKNIPLYDMCDSDEWG